DVFVPVTSTGRNISRQGKSRQGSHRDVVRAANPRLQHAAAPNRNSLFARDLFNLLGLYMPPNSSQLDVDDATSAELDRMRNVVRSLDRLVETNRSSNLPLQHRMIEHVVVSQRLL